MIRKLYKTLLFFSFLGLVSIPNIYAQCQESYIAAEKSEEAFIFSSSGKSAPILVSLQDYPGVIRVAEIFQNDVAAVTSAKPELLTDDYSSAKNFVLAGTIGKNGLIDQLISEHKLNVQDIAGKRETFLIQTIESPFPGVEKALVVAGSDKRGTIYGLFDISEEIGVSPWVWWADVPVKEKSEIYVLPGRYTKGEPKVKYRGFFINDEAPALSGWSKEKYGTEMFNHELYEHVFELILRLKGNFLWPAMWGRAFYDDDSLNPKIADELGVIIGTSHHEPFMRAHDEWRRYGSGPWNYQKNEDSLKEFWREGLERMGDYESVVTIGMRGDGDEPMSQDADIALLEKIVKDQREIIKDVTGKDPTETPQVWALYKEVQEYYDKGMRVPDDVTLLLCDDNWGNIRKLPDLKNRDREGGYGIYYHYDYVGGPRNYKWLNTNQISRVWEQMHLAYEYGVRELWIVNVGDIKPVEFPISFWFDYAWNPEAIKAEDLPGYAKQWAKEQFGEEYADVTANLIEQYTRFNSRRKPELLSPDTYSLTNYCEAETVVKEYKDLEEEARKVYNAIPGNYKAAFYQLVLHPIEACANLNEMYVAAGKNKLYAEQGRASTNDYADKVKELFERDSAITDYYNNKLADGKWSHMMDQIHIGYTTWHEPEVNIMPEVKKIELPEEALMGVAIEGSEDWYPQTKTKLILPSFDSFNKQKRYIEIFNRGTIPFNFNIKTDADWLHFSSSSGEIKKGQRIFVSVDWEQAPGGENVVPIKISGAGNAVMEVDAVVNNCVSMKGDELKGFMEGDGYVSIEAIHYNNAVENDSVYWQIIPGLGRTLSSITTFPVTQSSVEPGNDTPHLEYEVFLKDTGEVKVKAYLSPTLNFHNDFLRYAVSFDDEASQIIGMENDQNAPEWNKWVSENVIVRTSTHKVNTAGKHILKFWLVDPAVVLQKLVIETNGVKPSYLGPPESFKHAVKNDVGE